MDPAFDASLLGLKHWAYAWWEGWQKRALLCDAFRLAAGKMAVKMPNRWMRVTGPAAALLCFLERIGWTMTSASEATPDPEGPHPAAHFA